MEVTLDLERHEVECLANNLAYYIDLIDLAIQNDGRGESVQYEILVVHSIILKKAMFQLAAALGTRYVPFSNMKEAAERTMQEKEALRRNHDVIHRYVTECIKRFPANGKETS